MPVASGRADGELVLASESVGAVPLPQVARLRNSATLVKLRSWANDGRLVVLVERIGEAENQVLQTMAFITSEMTTLGRELAKRNDELQQTKARIEAISRTDPLTGLANRRHILEALEPAMSLARRHHQPLSVIMADLDHFKKVNDSFGHDAGDKVLCHVAQVLRSSCRREDLAVRMGGEEFLLLLPMTPAEGASHLAERIASTLRRTQPVEGMGPVTASIGIAHFRASDTGETFLPRADEAQYRAKAAGRDRIELERSSEEASETQR